MKRNLYISLILLTGFSVLQFSCNSGEYDLTHDKIDFVERIPVFDTIKIVKDTTTLDIKDEKLIIYNYYIQLGAFANKSYFDAFFENAKRNFGDEIYSYYQDGLYKIKINCNNNKGDCELILQKAISLGYFDSFIKSDIK